MSYNCSSGNCSSRSHGGYLGYPLSTYDAFDPSNIVYSPRTCQVDSSFYNCCQESFCEPTSCQTPCAVARSYQASCYHPKNLILCSPCQKNYAGFLECGNIGLGYLNYGSNDCGSSFSHPSYFSSGSYQSTCYQPAFGSRYFGSTY
ncbi:keratin-associated protein 15-1 [Orycteropus afer afer]|uniref:Keratin-associated protein n=1 Tax=Orycteropus afer afer TaxID=1230840 RepID=A0A8B6ZWL5_ORYAF|nr:keratin-associated protein 15-1 [Orycteropus afer afer]